MVSLTPGQLGFLATLFFFVVFVVRLSTEEDNDQNEHQPAEADTPYCYDSWGDPITSALEPKPYDLGKKPEL